MKIPQEIRNLIESGTPAHLVTLNKDGSPQLTLVWIGLDGDQLHAPSEFEPIDTQVPGIRICEHFPLLASRTDKLAIIRSMTHNNVDHTVATHFLLTGMPPLPGGAPCASRLARTRDRGCSRRKTPAS